jgi:hypothetical protein
MIINNNRKDLKSTSKLTAALQSVYLNLLDQKINNKLELVISENGKTIVLTPSEIAKHKKTILKTIL